MSRSSKQLLTRLQPLKQGRDFGRLDSLNADGGAQLGVIGAKAKGQKRGHYLDDPYFCPLYENSQDLYLVICVHRGGGFAGKNPQMGNRRATLATSNDHVAAKTVQTLHH
jgi:hypothetical protein